MENIKIPFLKDFQISNQDLFKKRFLTSASKFEIDQINWPEFSFKPQTEVYAGYDGKHLWLHFMVYDDYIRTDGKNDQDPVYQDSCVEFFIEVGDKYRNFEFNCIGVCLSAIGPDRHSRQRLDQENLSRIIRVPSLNPKDPPAEGSKSDWSLTVGIPLDLIGLAPGTKFRCNFYKCGDKTKIPHYVTWAPIGVPSPDYHRPEYFKEVELTK